MTGFFPGKFLRVGIYCYANFFCYANFSNCFPTKFRGGGKLPQGAPPVEESQYVKKNLQVVNNDSCLLQKLY